MMRATEMGMETGVCRMHLQCWRLGGQSHRLERDGNHAGYES